MTRAFILSDYILTLPDLPDIPNPSCLVSGVKSNGAYPGQDRAVLRSFFLLFSYWLPTLF